MSRRLRLLGVVDSNGVVHSQFDDDNKVKHHIDIWPIGHFINWRWNGNKGVYTFLEPFQDEETRFNVVKHVCRKVGIPISKCGTPADEELWGYDPPSEYDMKERVKYVDGGECHRPACEVCYKENKG